METASHLTRLWNCQLFTWGKTSFLKILWVCPPPPHPPGLGTSRHIGWSFFIDQMMFHYFPGVVVGVSQTSSDGQAGCGNGWRRPSGAFTDRGGGPFVGLSNKIITPLSLHEPCTGSWQLHGTGLQTISVCVCVWRGGRLLNLVVQEDIHTERHGHLFCFLILKM